MWLQKNHLSLHPNHYLNVINMKKLFSLAILALSAFSVSAQIWLGGSLGFDRTKEKRSQLNNYTVEGTQYSFDFSPEIGYNLSDKVAVALSLTYSHSSSSDISVTNNSTGMQQTGGFLNGATNSYSIAPYVRYYLTDGRLRLFADGQVGFSTSHTQGYDYSSNMLSVGVRPGLSFDVNDRLGLVCHVGYLGYSHDWSGDNAHGNIFRFELIDHLSLGLYFNL